MSSQPSDSPFPKASFFNQEPVKVEQLKLFEAPSTRTSPLKLAKYLRVKEASTHLEDAQTYLEDGDTAGAQVSIADALEVLREVQND